MFRGDNFRANSHSRCYITRHLKSWELELGANSSRCLVLGGCGFIGCNVVEELIRQDYPVRIFDVPTSNRDNLASVISAIEFVEGNFSNAADIEAALEEVDFVIHLVGTTLPASSNRQPAFDIESNLIGTIGLLEASVRRKIKRVVFASSGGTVYGKGQTIPITENHPTNPLCSYGISKLAIEKYMQLFHHLYGLDYTILRVANPYGKYQKLVSEQGAIGVFLARINEGKTITIWGDGSVIRDYIYVEDIARAFVKALSQNSEHRLFNIGTGIGLSLRDLIAKIERVTGSKAQVEYSAGRTVDVPTNILDATRANRFLNWHVETDFDTGLRKTLEWICSSKPYVAAAQGL